MIIRKNSRKLEVDELGIKIFDYNLKTDLLGISFQELNGRVPTKGSGRNREVDEWCMILEGGGNVTIDDVVEEFASGDVIFIPKGSTSYMNVNNTKMIVITSPDWFGLQYEAVD